MLLLLTIHPLALPFSPWPARFGITTILRSGVSDPRMRLAFRKLATRHATLTYESRRSAGLARACSNDLVWRTCADHPHKRPGLSSADGESHYFFTNLRAAMCLIILGLCTVQTFLTSFSSLSGPVKTRLPSGAAHCFLDIHLLCHLSVPSLAFLDLS